MYIKSALRFVLLLAELWFGVATMFCVIILLAGLLGQADQFFVGDDAARMQSLGFLRHLIFIISIAVVTALMVGGVFLAKRLRTRLKTT